MAQEPNARTRLDRLVDLHGAYWHDPEGDARIPDLVEKWDPDGVNDAPVPRYCTITGNDGDSFMGLYDTLDEALAGFAEEATGESSWLPVGLYDLDTGEQLPLNLKVVVTVSEDEGATLGIEID